jgi:hypothetical protein
MRKNNKLNNLTEKEVKLSNLDMLNIYGGASAEDQIRFYISSTCPTYGDCRSLCYPTWYNLNCMPR